MSLPGTLHSYFSIIQELRRNPYATKAALIAHVQSRLETFREKDGKAEKGLSNRSFGRDLKNIRNLFGITIQYNAKRRGYFIAGDGPSHRFVQEAMDSFHLLQAVQAGPGWEVYIQPDTRKDAGRQHLAEILHAIRQRRQLQFTYLKHWEDDPTHRTVNPYLLKEARQRWYLIAKDLSSEKPFKTFALDRMSQVLTTPVSFDLPPGKPYEAYHQHTFGVDSPHNTAGETIPEPVEVILSFVPPQGRYVKALPLHPTQQVLADDETEFRIRLQVYLTWDLESEVLSWGEEVKVLQPQALAQRIQARLQLTRRNYAAEKEKPPTNKTPGPRKRKSGK